MPKSVSANEKQIFSDQPVSLRVTFDHDQFAPNNDRSRLIRLAREVVSQTSEVRQEKVDRLKKAIAQGTYKIDCNKLASVTNEILSDITSLRSIHKAN